MDNMDNVQIVAFSNTTHQDKKLLRQFVDFHWTHYANENQYIPLLDYEYLGLKPIGMHGFFEKKSLFLKHTKMLFFLAKKNDQFVGRCNAFINYHHNQHWKDKVGFFGQFETINDHRVTHALISSTSKWLKTNGMKKIRGPQNLPVNEATPGVMTAGFNSRPVIYYHYNKPYYAEHLGNEGFHATRKVLSWEMPVQKPVDPKFIELIEKIIRRYGIQIETWNQRPLKTRKQEMLEIYNAAWDRNFGFVPFTKKEFDNIIDDMTLILDKGLFIFLYIHDEPAAFFGGVPNISEHLGRIGKFRNLELLRAIRVLLGKNKTKGFRLGYLGVKPKFQRLGLDAVMIWKQKQYAESRGYKYCDIGWVLEDNHMVIRMIKRFGGTPSKTYTIYEKSI
jgi:GNAT superfamily N-acetyltransferase